jgi:hypothetical protein
MALKELLHTVFDGAFRSAKDIPAEGNSLAMSFIPVR